MTGRPRRTASRILVVVGTLLAALAVLAVWVSRQALETDEWTRTSSALLEEPAVQDAVAGYLVDELYANVDVASELQAALPDRVDPLAAPIAGALRRGAEDLARRALTRPRVQQAWADANRRAHAMLLDVVVEGNEERIAVERGVVTLDLKALLGELAQRIGAPAGVVDKLPAEAARVEVLRLKQLGPAQSIARAIEPLTLTLLLGVFASFGGALALARDDRRRILRDCGLGLVFAGAAALVIRKLGGNVVVDELAGTAAIVPTVEATWPIATSLLLDAATAVIVYGAVIVAGAWLAGPSRVAVRVRSALAPYLRDPRITYGTVAAIVVLVLVWAPTEATRRPVPAMILIALALLGVEALRRQVRSEYPDATRKPGAMRGRLSDRLHRLRASLGTEHDGATAMAPASDRAVAQLERLSELHRAGGLDDDEFQAAKQRVLTTA